MSIPFKAPGPQTLAIHAGESPDPATGASAPPIVMSTTFIADPRASFSSENIDEDTPFIYTRWGNPTVQQLETKLAVLEGAEAAIAFGSGVAAISALLLYTLSAGDHLVMSDVTYAAASEFAADTLARLGIQVTKVDTSDLAAVAGTLRPNTRLVYLESPCNPILRLTDIAEVSRLAKAAGALVAVDSTFATPLGTKPLTLGADFVIHSLTKYFCGHGDALGGALLGSKTVLADLRKRTAIRTGGVLSPFNAWLILRGMATLPLRMRAHQENAFAVARFLEAHPKVRQVIYPGLPSHPQHELAARQMKNFSGMITFQVEKGPEAALAFAQGLQIIHYAVSLGHQRSLIFYLPTQELLNSSFPMGPGQQASYRTYAGEGIFRLSVGLEDAEDLIADLERGLGKL